jgi:hypothetical protein
VLEGTNDDTSWVTFDPNNLVFSWAAEASNVGVYRVELKGKIKNRRAEKFAETEFVLTIVKAAFVKSSLITISNEDSSGESFS